MRGRGPAVRAGTPAAHGIPAGPAPGPQSLSETGSTLLYPLLRAWAAGYHQQHPNASITRFGLEHSYRAQARLAPGARRRIELVDLASDVRPRTWA